MEKIPMIFEARPDDVGGGTAEKSKLHPAILKNLSKQERAKVGESLLRNIVPVEEMVPGTVTEDMPALDNNNPVSSEKVPGRSNPVDTTYIDFAIELIEKLDKDSLQKIKDSFKDKIIVDIGAGRLTKGYDLACYLGARGYIAVEPFNDSYLIRDFLNQKDKIKRKPNNPDFSKDVTLNSIPLNVVSEDGLSFLRRLPNESVVVFTFGLGDWGAISDEEYTSNMSKEAERVMNRDCYVLSANSLYTIPEESQVSEIFKSKDISEGTSIRKIEKGYSKKTKQHLL